MIGWYVLPGFATKGHVLHPGLKGHGGQTEIPKAGGGVSLGLEQFKDLSRQ